jgi:formylglycine-generating enzyme required for sulfatase activity
MGSEEFDSEKPAHQATVATFVLDRTEVTVAAYNGCVNAGRCTQRTSVDLPGITEDVRTKASAYCNGGKDGRSNHPMNCVDWNDATAFCSWAGKRLPTETEWEYAARGAEGRKYPWGYSEPADQLCWKRSNGTCSVGSFPSGNTPQGLVDMAGNVWEWTASNYCPYPSKSCTNAALVYRGGSWSNDNAPYVRGALRSDYEPGFRSYLLGFRCAR